MDFAEEFSDGLAQNVCWDGCDEIAPVGCLPIAGKAKSLRAGLPSSALHRLCQPLTALQCTLELGLMRSDAGELRSAMGDALGECVRAIAMLSSFRELLEADREYERDQQQIDVRDLARELGWTFKTCSEASGNAIVKVRGSEKGQVEGPEAQNTDREEFHAGAAVAAQPEAVSIYASSIEASSIYASAAGIHKVLRMVNRAILESGMGSGDLAGNMAGGQVRVEENVVKFVWEFDRPSTSQWREELMHMEPFEVVDYDFCGQGTPSLAIAGMVAECMEADFCCGTQGVAIGFRRKQTA